MRMVSLESKSAQSDGVHLLTSVGVDETSMIADQNSFSGQPEHGVDLVDWVNLPKRAILKLHETTAVHHFVYPVTIETPADTLTGRGALRIGRPNFCH